MTGGWYVNASTDGLTWDMAIAAIALTVRVLAESVSCKARVSLIAIPPTFLIGVGCGLPMHLFRSRGG